MHEVEQQRAAEEKDLLKSIKHLNVQRKHFLHVKQHKKNLTETKTAVPSFETL